MKIFNCKILSPLIIALAFLSCDKQDCETEVTFRMFTDHQGCDVLFSLDLVDESRLLEPINLDDFDINVTDGLKVCIEFVDRPDVFSASQISEPVELTSLTLID